MVRASALLGLTFKAGTDDLRESPALRLAEVLVARGATVVAFDPVATDVGRRAAGARWREHPGLSGPRPRPRSDADAVVVGTEWPEFGRLDWAAIAPAMRGRVIADARRIVDRAAANEAGLTVVTLGVAYPPDARATDEPSLVAVPVGTAAVV